MLRNRVKIYVPMNTVKQKKELERVFKLFCEIFGGATVNPVIGGWVNIKGILVKDKIGIIHSFADELTPEIRDMLKGLAVVIRNNLNEDCILLVINGAAEFY